MRTEVREFFARIFAHSSSRAFRKNVRAQDHPTNIGLTNTGDTCLSLSHPPPLCFRCLNFSRFSEKKCFTYLIRSLDPTTMKRSCSSPLFFSQLRESDDVFSHSVTQKSLKHDEIALITFTKSYLAKGNERTNYVRRINAFLYGL